MRLLFSLRGRLCVAFLTHMKKIEPAILKGTRDFLPIEMAKRNFVMQKIRSIFERFGYAYIETPILSPAETILGKYGEEGDRLTYHFLDNGEREVALPYDLTVPFARYIAANWSELPIPFKRYQIQRVWRAEKPQKGRLREFYQCDIDVVGTKSLLVEVEVAKIIVEVFKTLGIEFTIKFNSRRLMNAVLESYDIKDNSQAVIRVIDKLDKIGKEEVVRELEAIGVEKAKELMETLSGSVADFSSFDTSEIESLLRYAEEFGIEEYLSFDPSLARGLDYYTGIIFEVVSKDSDFGTICAGGRYDNLTSMFEISAPSSAVTETSGMGVAFGFERIMLLMEEKKLLEDIKLSTDVLVTVFDEASMNGSLFIYRELLEAGANAEIYFEPAKLEKQLKYADKKGIRFAIIRGPEEIERGEVKIKNLETGTQEVKPREGIAEALAEMLYKAF
jgi:histidyl-tRNA synthetase